MCCRSEHSKTDCKCESVKHQRLFGIAWCVLTLLITVDYKINKGQRNISEGLEE